MRTRIPSKQQLRQLQNTLIPGHPVRNAAAMLELAQVREVPPVVPEQRVLIRVLWLVAENPLGLLDRHERILRGRFVYPLVERREVEQLEQAQGQDQGRGREGLDLF